MKSSIALFCAFSFWEPLLANADVNKPPYPVVNIIADQPNAGSYKQLQSHRLSALAKTTYKEQAHQELSTQQRQLERLFKLRADTANRAPESLPVINVRLAAPKHPLPEVTAEIAVLEKEREKLEADLMDKLHAAFDNALASAKGRINKMIASSMQLLDGGLQTSFLQASEPDFSIRVSTVAVPAPDPSIKGVMDKIEAKRSDAETKLLEQAVSEMQGLTDIVLNELGAQIQAHAVSLKATAKHAAFLAVSQQESSKALPAQANVRVESGAAFPTIASMVQAMESRRDNAESQEASAVLELELKLLQEENAMIKTALGAAVQRIAA